MNIILFLGSCTLVASFAWWFYRSGKEALTAWIAMLSLLANLFVLKQIDFFNFNATASDIFAIGSLLSLNLLQEKFGQETARRAIWISFGCLLFFSLMSQIHLLYIPSEYDHSQDAYRSILMPSPRLLVASLTTFLLVDQFDSRLYAILRKRYPQISMFIISAVTMSLSQILDTALFTFLGLYGMVSAVIEIMVVSYCIKLLAIVNTVPWTFFIQQLFKTHYVKKSI